MSAQRLALLGLLAIAAVAACDARGANRVLGIEATGSVDGVVYFDRDGSGTLDAADTALRALDVSLLPVGTRDTAEQVRTRSDGTFAVADLAVGRYVIAIPASVLGDTITVTTVTPDPLDVEPGAEIQATVGVSYPVLRALSELPTIPLGNRVFLAGVALNDRATFGDSTVHVADSSGAVLVTGIRSGDVSAGDSVRFLGRVARRAGKAVLTDARAFFVQDGALPAPELVSAAAAAAGGNGQLDARLVRIDSATVVDTLTDADDNFVVTVTDTSGTVAVLFDVDVGFDVSTLLPSTVLDVSGLLVAVDSTAWQVRPRTASDLDVTVTVATTAAVQTLPLGTDVSLTGVATTPWNAFGDSTIHLADGSGAVRATVVAAATAAVGDSIRILGTIGTRDGRRALTNGGLTNLGAATPPSATSVTASDARSATGSLAAALVRLGGAKIVDTATAPGGNVVLSVTDASDDTVDVVLDADLALDRAGLTPSAVINATGVLVPSGGVWMIKPRANQDIVVAVPVVTLADVRSAALGEEVVVVAVALNDRTAFGDQSVHLSDATGALRATNVTTTTREILQGDSAAFRGTVGVQSGQRVLVGVTVDSLVNTGTPSATATTSLVASNANGGALDAALVSVTGATVSSRATQGSNIILTVTDGSGPLSIVLDGDTPIDPTDFVPGAEANFTGLLVPTGTGTWRLKPRDNSDLAVTVPVVSIADARGRPVGETVVVTGVALNDPTTFADSSIHMADTSGAIRGFVSGVVTIFAGDSIRLRGVTGTRLGQPTLEQAQPTFVATAAVPPPVAVTTSVAASAFGGRLDGNFVSVSSATISATSTVNGDFVMTVSDGSGSLEIVLDQDVGFDTTPYTVGATVTVQGVLVPTSVLGRWQLKPRAEADIS